MAPSLAKKRVRWSNGRSCETEAPIHFAIASAHRLDRGIGTKPSTAHAHQPQQALRPYIQHVIAPDSGSPSTNPLALSAVEKNAYGDGLGPAVIVGYLD